MKIATYLLFVFGFSQTQGVLIILSSGKVLGGAVNENTPKNTAAIFSNNRQHVCTGALVHPSWVLTSALCAKKTEKQEMHVEIGENFTNTTFNKATKIKNRYVYPTFDHSTLVDDIALLELEKPADNNAKVFTIPNVDENLYRRECIIRGYGQYETTHNVELPGNLTQRKVRLIDNSFCSNYPVSMTNKKLCTVEAACNGDQGAPLITADTNELVGIVSNEPQIICGFGAIPLTLYTKVFPYKNWIQSTANIDL